MKVIKRVLAFALVGAMAFNIMGCGKKTSDNKEVKKADTTTEAVTDDETTEETTEELEVKPLKVMTERRYASEWNDAGDKQYLDSDLAYAIVQDDTCPKLKEAVEADYKRLFDEDSKLNKEYLDESKNGGSDVPFANSNSIAIRRADSNVFSYMSAFYSNTGGAHGLSGTTCCNYNSATGEKIALSDVCKDKGKLIEAIKKELSSAYSDVSKDDLTFLDSYFENVDFNASVDEAGYIFLVDYNGVTFFFNPGDIAGYALGEFRVFVPYDEELFNAEYFNAPEYYITSLDNSINYVDVDSDGEVDKVQVGGENDGNDSDVTAFTKATIKVNDKETKYDIYSYHSSWYFVHSKNGDYIYLVAATDNDYNVIYAFSTKDSVKEVDHDTELWGLGFEVYNAGKDDSYSRQYIPTDCDSLILYGRCQVLSTCNANREYEVGADGYPVSCGKMAVIAVEHTLTLKKDLTLRVVDDATEEETSETLTLKAKDVVKMYKTDMDKVVDLKTEDGKIVRAHVDGFDFDKYDKSGQGVEGTDIEELFDGIIFAG